MFLIFLNKIIIFIFKKSLKYTITHLQRSMIHVMFCHFSMGILSVQESYFFMLPSFIEEWNWLSSMATKLRKLQMDMWYSALVYSAKKTECIITWTMLYCAWLLSHVRLFCYLIDCSLSLLQGIFSTQGLNLGLPLYRQFLYGLSNQGSRLWTTDLG